MANNNNFFNGNSENGLRALYAKIKNDPSVPVEFKDGTKTPERVASDYLDLWLNPGHVDYSKRLATVEHQTESGKNVKVRTMYLSDYEIIYKANSVTVEQDGEVINQTVLGNNIMFELQVGEILEYARLMYPEEDFNNLMEHVAKCVEDISFVPASAEYDSIHKSNGRKFKKAFLKDPKAKQAKKEVDALNKEKKEYDRERKGIDVINDDRRAEMNARVVLAGQPTPTPTVNNVIHTDRFTDRDRDE